MALAEYLVAKVKKIIKRTCLPPVLRPKQVPLLFSRKYQLVTLLTFVSLAFVFFTPSPVFASGDDYPDKWRNLPMDSVLDDWGMYNRQCTSFAAWRLFSKNGFSIPFHSNASNWASIASSRGYPVNSTPSVGAIAQFANHVAWVESVRASDITIEEYNNVDSNGNGIYGDDGTYSRRTIPASKPKSFIHFKDIVSDSNLSTLGIQGTFIGTNFLSPNHVLNAGEYILSNNVQFVLILQGDGNLVLYGNSLLPMWNSRTAGSGAVYAVMQGDGNLVLYRSNWTPVWDSNTEGRGESTLQMQDDGNLVVYMNSGIATWHTRTYGHSTHSQYPQNYLDADKTLHTGSYIRSPNKKFATLLSPDGNLVVYGPGYQVLWSANTGSKGVQRLVMQSDGNLVLYTPSNNPVWHSHTWGNGSSMSIMQDDGNFVIYRALDGAPSWSIYTGKL